MQLPELKRIRTTTDVISEFGGYDARTIIKESDFENSVNMTSTDYPVVRTRDHYWESDSYVEVRASKVGFQLCSGNNLYYLMGKDLYGVFGEEYKTLLASDFANSADDQIICMGDYIVTFPRGNVYDIVEGTVENIKRTLAISSDCGEYDLSIKQNINYYNSGTKKAKNTELEVNFTREYNSLDDREDCIALAELVGPVENFVDPNDHDVEAKDNMEIKDIVTSKPVSSISIELVGGHLHREITPGGGDYTYYTLNFKAKFKLNEAIAKGGRVEFDVIFDMNRSTVAEGKHYATLQMIDDNDTEINEYYRGDTAPDDPKDGEYWLDTSKKPNIIKVYSEGTKQWAQVLSSRYKFTYYGMNGLMTDYFKQYDSVEMVSVNPKHDDITGYWVLQEVGDNYFIINAVLPEFSYMIALSAFGFEFRIKRDMPTIDYVCECDNRLWGCSVDDNEIYCCRLGDPFSWYAYEDLSTDSYALKVGSKGAFTGVYNYSGNVIFFKEDFIHRIYGNKPQNYALKTLECPGIAEGSYKSTAVIDGTLFFHGLKGVYAYNGGWPSLISQAFGARIYHRGKAAAYKNFYHIDFAEESFVYDVKLGIWHKVMNRSKFKTLTMCSHYLNVFKIIELTSSYSSGEPAYMYYFVAVSNDEGYEWLRLADEDDEFYDVYDWELMTGPIGLSTVNRKWAKKIIIRAEMTGHVRLAVQYDDDAWEDLYNFEGKKKMGTVNIPIIPRRCDYMRLKFEGTGYFKLYSISKEIEIGSER